MCLTSASQRQVVYLALTVIVLLAMAVVGYAQTGPTGQTGAITTALPFLNISPNARNGSLGDVGVASTRDATSEYWNPAALAFVEHRFGFNVAYNPWLRGLGLPDVNLAYMPFYYNFGEQGGVLGASVRFFSLGDIQFTDDQGLNTGNYNASEMALGVSYAHVVTENLSVGGGLRYVRSDLAGASGIGNILPANTASGDLAVYYGKDLKWGANLPGRFSWGVNISNIGPKVQYNQASAQRDFQPTNLRLGYALRFDLDEYNSLTFMNDFNKLMVPSYNDSISLNRSTMSGMIDGFRDARGGFSEELSEFTMGFGLEYWYNNLFAVRGGYFYEDPNKGDRQFMTMGAGLKFKVVSIDFSYLLPFTQNHPLQNTIRLSLGFDFN